MTTRRFFHSSIITMTLILSLTLTGCAGVNTNAADQSPSSQKESSAAEKLSKFITLEDAKTIALKHANVDAADARFDDREFDLDDGTPVYELEFKANGVEYEYDVHAETGEIVRHKIDDKKAPAITSNSVPAENSREESSITFISLDEAKTIALQHANVNASDAFFDDRDFDLEGKTPIYELEFKANGVEYEYAIHAKTGEILHYEMDRN